MKPKIKSIHFREDERGTRYIEATFTDDECICVTALELPDRYKMVATLNCQDKYSNIVHILSGACFSYLIGDEEETMSYDELSKAEICFQLHCCRTNIPINTELYQQAECDFASRLSHFEDWDA